MSGNYSIQEIAKLTGMGEHTLRYYEKIGLIRNVNRNSNGYRSYTDNNLSWLMFINKLRKTGMSVGEMVSIAMLYVQGDETYRIRRDILQNHREKVELEIKDLMNNLEEIDKKINYYMRKEDEYYDGLCIQRTD